MKIIDPGHHYWLDILDDPGASHLPQQLTFVKREGTGYPGNVGHHPGTTSQEVIRALIERGDYVNGQVPCAETEAAVALMRSALLLLELRAARRHGRHLDLETTAAVEHLARCRKCGHVGCVGACHP